MTTEGDNRALLSGKRAFLELLKQEGVEIIFGNPGTTELPLMDALAVEHDIRYVLGLQEAAVMAMADGYAQASGKLAVLNLHVAPGLGNAMGMLYDAQKAGRPILVTAGQQDLEFASPSRSCGPICRPGAAVRQMVGRGAPRSPTCRASCIAPPRPRWRRRPGRCSCRCPATSSRPRARLDLLAPTRVAPRAARRCRTRSRPPAALLAQAKRPVIIAGDAVAQSRAHAELVALAELIGAPVYAEFVPSTASFPASHPLFRGADRGCAARCAQCSTSTICCSRSAATCSRCRCRPTSSRCRRAPAHPSRHRSVGARQELSGRGRDPRRPQGTLPELTAAVRDAHDQRRTRRGARARSRPPARRRSPSARRSRPRRRRSADKTPVQPLALLNAIGEMLPKDAVVIEEALSSAPGIRSLIRSDDPQSYFGLRGGGIGWGLPAAIGVKLALPRPAGGRR